MGILILDLAIYSIYCNLPISALSKSSKLKYVKINDVFGLDITLSVIYKWNTITSWHYKDVYMKFQYLTQQKEQSAEEYTN